MKKITSLIFVIIICVFSVAVFALPDTEISELENRSLTTRKDISPNALSGDFQSSVENFVSDQFPLRDKFMLLYTGMLYASGQREIDGTYICKDGRLVQYVTDADINEKTLVSFARKVNRLAENYTVYVMYVPSACVELKDKMPAGRPTYNYQALYDLLSSELGNATLIDLSDTLSDENFFYKTDHHWTAYGAYEAYRAFCDAKGEKPKETESFNLKTVSNFFRGTLYSKVPFCEQTDEIIIPTVEGINTVADSQSIDFYNFDALEVKDKYNVFQGGNHGIVEITNENGNGKTLLILKDSFANSFVPFIADEYSKIVMIDERYTFISLEDFTQSLSPDEILVLREIIN